jgi:hypothetical protein
VALTATGIAMGVDFSETDNCQNTPVPAGGSCTIQVAFSPSFAGARAEQMIVSANVYGGQTVVDLTGTGLQAGLFTVTPATVDFWLCGNGDGFRAVAGGSEQREYVGDPHQQRRNFITVCDRQQFLWQNQRTGAEQLPDTD